MMHQFATAQTSTLVSPVTVQNAQTPTKSLSVIISFNEVSVYCSKIIEENHNMGVGNMLITLRVLLSSLSKYRQPCQRGSHSRTKKRRCTSQRTGPRVLDPDMELACFAIAGGETFLGADAAGALQTIKFMH